MKVNLIIKNANELITLSGFSGTPARGEDMEKLGIIKEGAIAIEDGRIVDVGKTHYITQKYSAEETIDATGKIVLPGFIDSHTHLIFAGSREEELTLKLKGVPYLEILKRGGGILKTMKATRKADIEELVKLGEKRLDIMLRHGVTTVEGKSGYGLDFQNEIKILRAYKRLNERHPVDVVPTLLAAHAIPPEYKDNIDDYVELIIEKIIPAVAKENLAKFNDVFLEKGVFDKEQTKKILLSGKEYGLLPKLHADEINDMGGAKLAAEIGAVSADHLARASTEGIKALSRSNTVAVLLPTAPMVLMDYAFPKAREMIKLNVPIAIATDFNPNCWVENIQTPMYLATYFMKMTPAETITATTINAAHAVGLANVIGSLEPGKQADVIVMNAPSHLWVNYRFGVNLVNIVIKKGVILVE